VKYGPLVVTSLKDGRSPFPPSRISSPLRKEARSLQFGNSESLSTSLEIPDLLAISILHKISTPTGGLTGLVKHDIPARPTIEASHSLVKEIEECI